MSKGNVLYDNSDLVKNAALSDYDLITRISGVDAKLAKGEKCRILQMDSSGNTFAWITTKKTMIIACLTKDETHAVDTNIAPVSLIIPYGGDIVGLPYAEIETAGTTGTLTVDINKNGSTIFDVKITIDSGELTSRTAETPPELAADAFVQFDKCTIDIDGIHTTPGKGLTIYIPIGITDF